MSFAAVSVSPTLLFFFFRVRGACYIGASGMDCLSIDILVIIVIIII